MPGAYGSVRLVRPAPGATLVARARERLEPRHEAGRDRGRPATASELGLCFGERALSGGEVGGGGTDSLGFVLAGLLRGCNLPLELRDRELALLDVGLGVGEVPLTAFDRAEHLERGLLLLLDVRLEARQRA